MSVKGTKNAGRTSRAGNTERSGSEKFQATRESVGKIADTAQQLAKDGSKRASSAAKYARRLVANVNNAFLSK